MRTLQYLDVLSEYHAVERMVAEMPATSVINRMSMKHRLQNLREEMERIDKLPCPTQTVRLTFKGKPIVGTRSISADFGAKALEAFSDVFTAVAVDSTVDLRSRGRIPEKEKNLLQIVGTVAGSFGFELELPQETPGLFTSSEETIHKIETLLEVSTTGNDDEVADVVSDLSPRARNLLNNFLGVLISNESWCGLSYGNKEFHYDNLEQVQKSVERLEDNNIHVGTEILFGKFKGFFPIGRTFEFLPESETTEQKSVLHGKIAHAIDDPDILNHEWLEKSVKVTLHSTQVGRGKHRYTLQSLDDLSLM